MDFTLFPAPAARVVKVAQANPDFPSHPNLTQPANIVMEPSRQLGTSAEPELHLMQPAALSASFMEQMEDSSLLDLVTPFALPEDLGGLLGESGSEQGSVDLDNPSPIYVNADLNDLEEVLKSISQRELKQAEDLIASQDCVATVLELMGETQIGAHALTSEITLEFHTGARGHEPPMLSLTEVEGQAEALNAEGEQAEALPALGSEGGSSSVEFINIQPKAEIEKTEAFGAATGSGAVDPLDISPMKMETDEPGPLVVEVGPSGALRDEDRRGPALPNIVQPEIKIDEEVVVQPETVVQEAASGLAPVTGPGADPPAGRSGEDRAAKQRRRAAQNIPEGESNGKRKIREKEVWELGAADPEPPAKRSSGRRIKSRRAGQPASQPASKPPTRPARPKGKLTKLPATAFPPWAIHLFKKDEHSPRSAARTTKQSEDGSKAKKKDPPATQSISYTQPTLNLKPGLASEITLEYCIGPLVSLAAGRASSPSPAAMRRPGPALTSLSSSTLPRTRPESGPAQGPSTGTLRNTALSPFPTGLPDPMLPPALPRPARTPIVDKDKEILHKLLILDPMLALTKRYAYLVRTRQFQSWKQACKIDAKGNHPLIEILKESLSKIDGEDPLLAHGL